MTTLGKYDTLIDAIEGLQREGYNVNFIQKGGGLQYSENKKHYRPQEIQIKEYHRFREKSSTSNSSVIFALECNDGSKGVIISSFGTYADMDLLRILDKIKIKPKNDTQLVAIK